MEKKSGGTRRRRNKDVRENDGSVLQGFTARTCNG